MGLSYPTLPEMGRLPLAIEGQSHVNHGRIKSIGAVAPVGGEPFGRSGFVETLDEIGAQDRLVEPGLARSAFILREPQDEPNVPP